MQLSRTQNLVLFLIKDCQRDELEIPPMPFATFAHQRLGLDLVDVNRSIDYLVEVDLIQGVPNGRHSWYRLTSGGRHRLGIYTLMPDLVFPPPKPEPAKAEPAAPRKPSTWPNSFETRVRNEQKQKDIAEFLASCPGHQFVPEGDVLVKELEPLVDIPADDLRYRLSEMQRQGRIKIEFDGSGCWTRVTLLDQVVVE